MGELVEVTLEIDAELKVQAEKICAEKGLTLEEAFVLFAEEKQFVWGGSLLSWMASLPIFLMVAVTRGFKKKGKVSKL